MRNLLYIVLVLFITLPALAQDTATRTATTAYNEAVEKIHAKDYESACKLYEEALMLTKVNPSDSTNMKIARLANKNGSKAAYNYGIALRKTEKYEEAIIIANKGIQMDDDFYANYLNLGKALDKIGKTKEAVAAFFKAAQYSEEAKRPADKTASLYRSGFLKLYKAKDYDAILESIAIHEGALVVPDINYYAAKSYAAKGNLAKAIEHAAKAGELGTGGKSVGKYYNYLGELYKKTTKVDRAIAAYKKIPEGDKYYSQAQYNITKLSN